MSTGTHLPTLLPAATTGPRDREQRRALARTARALTYLGLGWHVLEAAVAIGAGVVAGSVALIGFGADSVIEGGAGLVVLWLVTGGRVSSGYSELRAQQLIAVSFVLLAAYVTVESAHDLLGGHPQAGSASGSQPSPWP